MKSLITILLLFSSAVCFSQSHVINEAYSNGQFGKKLTINSTVAKTPLSITTGGGTDTIQCATCGIGSITGLGSSQRMAFWSSTTYLSNNTNYRVDTAKGYFSLGGTQPSSVFHVFTPAPPGTISVTASGATVTGTSTTFLITFAIGQSITANGETRVISAIASNTSMTTATNWTNTFSGAYVNGTTGVSSGVFQLLDNGNFNSFGNRVFYNTASSTYGNTGLGTSALNSITTGVNVSAFGFEALKANTTGNYNTAVGHLSLTTNISGASNTAVGAFSLRLSTGANNTAVGQGALTTNSTGANNTAVGVTALGSNSTGASNVAVGVEALSSQTSSLSTAVGYQSAKSSTVGITAVGYQALFSNTTGASNTAFGQETLFRNTTGTRNTAFGFQSGILNVTGNDNTVFGLGSLNQNSIGRGNTSVGSSALYLGTTSVTGTTITAPGTGYTTATATFSAPPTGATATGTVNLSAGAVISITITNAGTGYTSAPTVTLSGNGTGATATATITTANNNTALGDSAGLTNVSGSNNIYIGSNVKGVAALSDKLYIDNADNGASSFLYGDMTSGAKNLTINGGLNLAYAAKTSTYSVTAADHTINCTSGTFTVTLPTAVSITGRQYTILNSGSGTITIATTSSQTFVNINATPTTLSLAAVGAAAIVSYTVESNGANWIVTGKVKNE